MLASDRVAIAAHLHVLLRRRTGRVTDTEWMAINADYASAMVRFARHHAVKDNAPELDEWATRLERAWATPLDQPRQTFMDAAVRTVAMRVNPDGTQASPPPPPPYPPPGATVGQPAPPAAPGAPGAPRPPGGPTPPAGGSRYIGGIR